MTPLSPKTQRHLEAVFAPAHQAAARELLTRECGQNLPFSERSTPVELERVRFAATKLSEGRLDGLCEAVELAKIDSRDLLMAAGFGSDVRAHERWQPGLGPRRE